jgi:hypothetical protein
LSKIDPSNYCGTLILPTIVELWFFQLSRNFDSSNYCGTLILPSMILLISTEFDPLTSRGPLCSANRHSVYQCDQSNTQTVNTHPDHRHFLFIVLNYSKNSYRAVCDHAINRSNSKHSMIHATI